MDVNEYQHFALTYDSNGLANIFVNGSAATYDTSQEHKFFGGPDNGDVGLSLGAVNPFEGGAPHEGQSVSFDDFAIFGEALDATQIDSIINDGVRSFASGPGDPPATVFTWGKDSVGDWAIQPNWSFTGPDPIGGIRANNANHTAIFGDQISGPTIVGTHASVTVNRIEFNNTANSYFIAGGGSVHLAANTDSDTPVDPSILVQGAHEFQASVKLLANATVDVSGDGTLVFNNTLDLAGQTLSKIGSGTMSVRNDLTLGGGTLAVQQGVISGNGTIGGDVANTGGTISPGNNMGATAVPEPHTWLLLSLAWLTMLCWRNRGTPSISL